MALTKTKRKHKLDRHVDEATREAIFQKIAASMAKKAAKPRHNCPACGVLITRIGGILRHMDSCCPDLLTPEERAKVGRHVQLTGYIRGIACGSCVSSIRTVRLYITCYRSRCRSCVLQSQIHMLPAATHQEQQPIPSRQ